MKFIKENILFLKYEILGAGNQTCEDKQNNLFKIQIWI